MNFRLSISLGTPPFGNDTANAHRLGKGKQTKNIILQNENSGNLSSKSIPSFLKYEFCFPPQNQTTKKSKPIKNLILQNENSGNLSSRSIQSFFYVNLLSHHKIHFKRSK